MAELLGLVASAITVVEVAGHVATTVVALKRLWTEVRDVPETVNALMEQLEVLHPVLEDMESQFLDTRFKIKDDVSAKISMKYCRRAVSDLENLVNDMSRQIASTRRSRRMVAKVKVVIKKDLVLSYQERLKGALHLLSMSQQNYLIALTKLQPSIILAELQAAGFQQQSDGKQQSLQVDRSDDAPTSKSGKSTNTEPWLENTPVPWNRAGIFGRVTCNAVEKKLRSPPDYREEAQQAFHLRIQTPSWLEQKAWDMQAYKTTTGWRIHLKSWNILPNTSPIFRHAQHGSSSELLAELRSKRASLYDRSENGGTLLHLAASGNNLENFKILVNMGLSLREVDFFGTGAVFSVGIAEILSRPRPGLEQTTALDIFQFILSESSFGQSIEDIIFPEQEPKFVPANPIWRVHGLLGLLVKSSVPHYYQMPAAFRFGGLSWFGLNPKILLDVLQHDTTISPEAFRTQFCSASSQASLWYFSYRCLWYMVSEQLGYPIGDWRLLTRWLFSMSPAPDIPCVASPRSLFSDRVGLFDAAYFASRNFRQGPFHKLHRRLLESVRAWVEDLGIAGVDLEKYGKLQWEIYTSKPWLMDRRWSSSESRPEVWASGPKLASFTYGPRPEDWNFVWDHATEEFAGNFWELIEDMPPPVPGGWVDYDG